MTRVHEPTVVPEGWAGNLIGLTILLAGGRGIAGHSVEMRFSVVFMFCVSL
jgi:hypothetical protein